MENREFNPFEITRPDKKLLKYYMFNALCTGPFFPIVIIPLYLKYNSMKYSIDENGISMSWGILFRNEIHLTYQRIQDIHLSRGIIQRWMGLSTLEIQTASGSSQAEMVIEGILETEELRDFLYSKMKGAVTEKKSGKEIDNKEKDTDEDEALHLLKEIRDLLVEQNRMGKS